MTQLASDDFNRADSGNLGVNWTNDSGVNLQVQTNVATIVSNNFALCTFTGISWAGVNDQYAECQIKTLESTRDMGLVVRSTGTYFTTDTAYLAIINSLDAAVTLGSSMRVQLTKTVSNVFTDLVNVDMVVNTNDIIRLEANGTNIRVLINGVVQLSTTDADVTAGNPGIFISSGTAGGSQWDNFAAGDFSGGGGVVEIPQILMPRMPQIIFIG